MEIEGRVAHCAMAKARSLAEIIHVALTRLAEVLHVPEAERPARIPNAIVTILHPYPTAALHHLRGVLPPLIGSGHPRVHICQSPASPHSSPDRVFETLLRQCNTFAPGVRPEEILVVRTGMGRTLAPALAHGHATALIRRPGNLEANVLFRVSQGEGGPVPSVTAGNLTALCTELD
ncbi:hypothetical protein C8Q79DRAFT_317684 [Trametes meyenii]|nr:hypothetical protein C8Q79DRAFT_317684 [Trametes meyenii]